DGPVVLGPPRLSLPAAGPGRDPRDHGGRVPAVLAGGGAPGGALARRRAVARLLQLPLLHSDGRPLRDLDETSPGPEVVWGDDTHRLPFRPGRLLVRGRTLPRLLRRALAHRSAAAT